MAGETAPVPRRPPLERGLGEDDLKGKVVLAIPE
jgi:hypothetical protein